MQKHNRSGIAWPLVYIVDADTSNRCVVGLERIMGMAIKIGIAEMPARVMWQQLFSATWLAGIGFTMSLFITNSAFVNASLLSTAKISILIASLLAGTVGFVLLLLTTSQRVGATQLGTATTSV
jgi:Na+/H+ antiporter NhaA